METVCSQCVDGVPHLHYYTYMDSKGREVRQVA